MDVRVEELPAFNVAVAKAKSCTPEAMGDAWAKLISWLGSKRATSETDVGAGIGIFEGKPGARTRKYEAAWPVGNGTKGDRTIKIKQTKPGMYAIARHEGHPSAADAVYEALLDEWIPTSMYKVAKGPYLILHRTPIVESFQVVDVAVPVEPR